MRGVYSIEGRLITGAAPSGAAMGILTYIKIGFIAVVFVAGLWFGGKAVYNHEQKKLANQATIIANQKVEQQMMAKILINVNAYNKKKGVNYKKEAQNESENRADVQGAIDSGDIQRIITQFGKLSADDTQGNPSANGGSGGAKTGPSGKAKAAPE